MTEFRPTMQERKNRRVGYFVLVAEPAAWKNPQYFRGNGHSCGFSNRQNISSEILRHTSKKYPLDAECVCGTHTGPAIFLTKHIFWCLVQFS